MWDCWLHGTQYSLTTKQSLVPVKADTVSMSHPAGCGTAAPRKIKSPEVSIALLQYGSNTQKYLC